MRETDRAAGSEASDGPSLVQVVYKTGHLQLPAKEVARLTSRDVYSILCEYGQLPLSSRPYPCLWKRKGAWLRVERLPVYTDHVGAVLSRIANWPSRESALVARMNWPGR